MRICGMWLICRQQCNHARIHETKWMCEYGCKHGSRTPLRGKCLEVKDEDLPRMDDVSPSA
jgi:hypothetical protein